MTESVWQPRWEAARPAYERKIGTYSKLHFRKIPGYDQDDLETELYEVLWRCVKDYDPNNGATFNTYFWQSVKNRFADLIKHAFRLKRQANIYTESLDKEAVALAVEERMTDPSAEDEALARFAVREHRRHREH